MTLPRALLAVAAALFCAVAAADESPPIAVPKGSPRENAARAYNDGVKLMLDRRYAEAQRRFEDAIALDEKLAPAHNNLAFSLRMQGSANFERAMGEYRRALELDPKLAQAYMYRGVLHLQMGNADAARADLATLRGLDAPLAAKLEQVIAQQARDEREGLAPQLEGVY
ncbi:MAG TPA: tetratricopeptide repeat protein [Usitatibacter sp.]|nr:tetratricopeptide repeat protein [Usitatibacter sp.]